MRMRSGRSLRTSAIAATPRLTSLTLRPCSSRDRRQSLLVSGIVLDDHGLHPGVKRPWLALHRRLHPLRSGRGTRSGALSIFSLRKLREPLPIPQHDVRWRRDCDHTFALELRERAADCLGRQAEIVSDVIARHRDENFVVIVFSARPALGHREKEARDLFGSTHAPEQQHLVLGGAKLVAGRGEKAAREARHLVDQAVELGARIAAQRDFGDGFGRIEVALVMGKAQKVARREEAGYLAPPIGQELEELEHAPDHLVDVVGRVALAEDQLAGC